MILMKKGAYISPGSTQFTNETPLTYTLKCIVKSDLSGGTCRARVMHKGISGWWRYTTLNKDKQKQEGLSHWTLLPGQILPSIVCIECQRSMIGNADCFSCFSIYSQRIPSLRAKTHWGSRVQCKHSQIVALMWIFRHQKCEHTVVECFLGGRGQCQILCCFWKTMKKDNGRGFWFLDTLEPWIEALVYDKIFTKPLTHPLTFFVVSGS